MAVTGVDLYAYKVSQLGVQAWMLQRLMVIQSKSACCCSQGSDYCYIRASLGTTG